MPNILKSFAIDPQQYGYRLRIAAEGGTGFEIPASFDQLDLIAEDIDRPLDADQDPSN